MCLRVIGDGNVKLMMKVKVMLEEGMPTLLYIDFLTMYPESLSLSTFHFSS